MQSTMHVYDVRPRKEKRGVDLISNALRLEGNIRQLGWARESFVRGADVVFAPLRLGD